MKKLTILIVAVLLCLNFPSRAQDKTSFQVPEIGQQVPDVTITNLSNYPTPTARLSDFRGKLLIIDFWATWCSPCIAMIPKMDSLQQQFGSQIQFLSVSDQPTALVTGFMKKLEDSRKVRYAVPQVSNDTVLSKLFPHRFLPHYVWIDQDGKLRAITEFQAVNAATIKQLLLRKAPDIVIKQDAPMIPYNDSVPLLVNGNGGDGTDLIYHSVLTNYKAGLPLQMLIQPEKDGALRILCKNLNPLQLFAVAHSDKGRDFLTYLDSIKLQVRDTSKLTSYAVGMEYDHWLANGHGFCYELKVPAAMRKMAFGIMREEIGRFFPDYVPSLIAREEQCFVLKSTGQNGKLKTKGGTTMMTVDQFGTSIRNQPLRYWVASVNAHGLLKLPLVNATGFTGNIDLTLKNGFNDLKLLNDELRAYGLEIAPGTQKVNQLVISDRPPLNPN